MNSTNLDYLFQLTAPSQERPAFAPARKTGRGEFNDHLAVAADSGHNEPSANSEIDDGSRGGTPPAANGTFDESDDEYTSDDDRSTAAAGGNSVSGPTETSAAPEEQPPGGQIQPTTLDTAIKDDDLSQKEDELHPDELDEFAVQSAGVTVDEPLASAVATLTPKASETEVAVDSADKTAASDRESASEGYRVDAKQRIQPATSPAAASDEAVEFSVPVNDEQKSSSSQASQPVNAALDEPVTENADAEAREAQDAANNASRGSPQSTVAAANVAVETATETPRETTGVNAKPESAALPEAAATEIGKSTDERRDRLSDSHNRATATSNQAIPTTVAASPGNQVQTSAATQESGEGASRSVIKPVSQRHDLPANPPGRAQRPIGTTTSSAQATDTAERPQVNAARFVGRVAKAVQTAHERGTSLQLRLSPPELGSLRLELTVQNGVMTAALETETSTARQVLLDHLPALRDRLAEQNIRIERFDVDVRQENSGGQADSKTPQHGQRQQQSPQPNPQHASSRARVNEAPVRTSSPVGSRLTTNGINVLA